MSPRIIDGPFVLDLGGLSFRISPDTPLVFPDPSGAYEEFLIADSDADHEIAVSIRMSGCPDVASLDVLFDADDAWSLRAGKGGPCFVGHGPPSIEGPPWVLKIEDDANATVFGNSVITDSSGNAICPIMYPVDQLLCVNMLAGKQGMLVHCAGLKVDDKVYICAGKSGGGKTTLSECVAESDRISILSDDRMIIRQIDGEFRAFGTPWPGDGGYAKNEGGVLGGIFFLEHGQENELTALSVPEIVERLMSVVSVPWYDETKSGQVMQLIGCLAQTLRCGSFKFRPDDELGAFVVKHIAMGAA